MATTYPKSWKQCATCAFWSGARQSDVWGDNVTVDEATVRGKCAIPSGGFKHHDMPACSTCSDWQKWPVLK